MRAFLLLLVLGGCAGSQPGAPRGADAAAFAFIERYGRDCFMMGLCEAGYVVRGDRVYAYEERDARVWTDSARFGAEEQQALNRLLREGGFFEAPPQVPAEPGVAGGRTLTLQRAASAGEPARETTLHFDARSPLPEWAYALEATLRRFFQDALARP